MKLTSVHLPWNALQRWFVGFFAVAVVAANASAVEVVSVAEHWELQIGEPDTNRSSPQVSMTMSPTGNLEGIYFVFSLNHRSVPAYVPGGMQVQLWDGSSVLENLVGPTEALLSHNDETVAWVQKLSLHDGTVTFEVIDVTSQSWGNFGGDGQLQASTSLPLSNLNGYRPGLSLQEADVGYAGNRVRSLVLKKLVWTTSDGEQHELLAPIDVDTDLDP
jgi:hypothetical protein